MARKSAAELSDYNQVGRWFDSAQDLDEGEFQIARIVSMNCFAIAATVAMSEPGL
jgi:hypothetical protein